MFWMMVVPGNAPVIQQDHVLEPDLGRDSTENSAMGPETEPAAGEVTPELDEVRKLRELVRRLEIENQHPRTKGGRNVHGTNVQGEIHTGVDNHDTGLNGMEIHNSINAITENRELQIMADLHSQLSKMRKEDGENNCLKRDMDAPIQHTGATQELSSTLFKADENLKCSSCVDTSNSPELRGSLGTAGVNPLARITEQNPSEKCGDGEGLSSRAELDEVKVLELESCHEEEDSWYVPPNFSDLQHLPSCPGEVL